MTRNKSIGKDAFGQEVVPIEERLNVVTNTTESKKGYEWGWIEGCKGMPYWSEETKFNKDEATNLVIKYNKTKKQNNNENRKTTKQKIFTNPR